MMYRRFREHTGIEMSYYPSRRNNFYPSSFSPLISNPFYSLREFSSMASFVFYFYVLFLSS